MPISGKINPNNTQSSSVARDQQEVSRTTSVTSAPQENYSRPESLLSSLLDTTGLSVEDINSVNQQAQIDNLMNSNNNTPLSDRSNR